MNISFAGLHGTGKSTIAKLVADHFHFQFYSTGMAFRELAADHKMNLEEFSKYAEAHKEIDQELDGKIIKLAQSGKNYVFEGQLPTYMLGDLKDFAILFTCCDDIRLGRMATRDGQSIEVQKHETIVREASERQRFIDFYQIDIMDPTTILGTFDLILDTTQLGIEAIVNSCVAAISGLMKKKKITK